MTIVKELNTLSEKVVGTNPKATTDAQAVKYIADNYTGGGGGSYVLPKASADTLGGVKVGNNLSIDANGVLSATGGGSSAEAIVIDIGEYLVNAVDAFYDENIEYYNQVLTDADELKQAFQTAYNTWLENKNTKIYLEDSEDYLFFEVSSIGVPVSAQDGFKFYGTHNSIFIQQSKAINHVFNVAVSVSANSFVITTAIKNTELTQGS